MADKVQYSQCEHTRLLSSGNVCLVFYEHMLRDTVNNNFSIYSS